MQENEIWKDVADYEGYYKISNLGRLFGIKRNVIKNPSIEFWGYENVCLSKNSKQKVHKIHRLVAIAFIANTENKPQVNHINGIKTDNRAENLEWVTDSENKYHSVKIGTKNSVKGDKHGMSKLNTEILRKCIALRNKNYTYTQIKDVLLIENNFKINSTTINKAILGNTWRHIKN